MLTRRPWLAILLGVALALPTVSLPLFADDYALIAGVEGKPLLATPFDLFRFAPGDSAELSPFIDRGPYPWWTLPELRLRFFRPLSSALVVLDHTLFGRSAVAFHLHSIAWYAAAIALSLALFRRTLSAPAAALASVLFAMAPSHFLPAAWASNRNALVAFCFAAAGVWLHLQWRENNRRLALPASLLCFALALLAGEAAIAMMAYLAGFELFAAPGRRLRDRLFALAPSLGLGAVYVIAYRALGYGAWGSSTYVDPTRAPLAFAQVAPGRLLALIGAGLGAAPADLWAFSPRTHLPLALTGLLLLAAFVALLKWAWPRLEPGEALRARGFLAGAALGLLPVAATFPNTRLLLAPSVGVAAVLALLLRAWWSERKTERRWPRGAAFCAGVIAFIHLGWAPLGWLGNLAVTRVLMNGFQTAVRPVALEGLTLSDRRVVVINSPDPFVALYTPIVALLERNDRAQAWWPLSLAPLDLELKRTSESSLELTAVDGAFLDSVFEQLVRDDQHPTHAGQRFVLDGLTAEVLDVSGPWPTRVAFTFDRSLDDPSMLVLVWSDGALRPWVSLPVGATTRLPHQPLF